MSEVEQRLHFVAVVEPGDLERKCTLLLESLREFGGELAGAPCWFVQPRRGARLSRRTHRIFYDLDARLVACDLNREWTHYPISNKIFASAFVERLLPSDDTVLCFVDSDIACFAEPSGLLLDDGVDVGLRPVDQVGRGQRADAPLAEYWRRVFDICEVPAGRAWNVRSNVERVEILGYFNAGMIAARRRAGLFGHWLDALQRSREDGPFLGKQLHNLDQSLLAGVVFGRLERERAAILSPGYNYPLHLHAQLPAENAVSRSDEMALAHYHGLFYKRQGLDGLPFTKRHRAWLDSRVPIETMWQRQVRRAAKLNKSAELRAKPG